MSFKGIAAIARAACTSALMFLAGAIIPFAGVAIMAFAPAPLLGYAVGFPHTLLRISAAAGLSAALVSVGSGPAAGAAYLMSFGMAAVVMCLMLERRQPFELTVVVVTGLVLTAGTIAALIFAGSRAALVRVVHEQLIAGMFRGEGFYRALGVDAALAAGTRSYIADTVEQLLPAFLALMGALMVLLNLAVFWRWGGKQQRLGYTLFGDLARWSAPEWLIWPLLVSGFGWFVPLQPIATIALDCFVCVVGVYFCQGLAIMAFYFRQLKMPAVARGLIYFITLAQPVLSAMVGAAGVFDLWVDFRRLKRPNAAARDFL